MTEKPYWILAYYKLCSLSNPLQELQNHRQFLNGRDVTCRVYISEQGINGQLCAIKEDALAYISWLQQHAELGNIHFKVQDHHEHVYPRMTIKYRKQLVALDMPWDIDQRGELVSPTQWRQMLREEADRVLLDIRNDYEWAIGHFEGAEAPPCKTFRDFQRYATELKSKINPETTPVMMACTGGIRCELFSAVLKQQGFKRVYQLEGGIINYGLQYGSEHWVGKLFVFDDRLSIPLQENDPAPVIGQCYHCQGANDTYYNCANMDCNELFLCCPECIKKFQGCCKIECLDSPRLRPYQQVSHKPFRKWYHYTKEKRKQ